MGAAFSFHAQPALEVCRALGVDSRMGLSSEEAARRAREHGENRLAEPAREPRWRAFLRQFQDRTILILLVAAVVSFFAAGDIETPIAILVVVLLNAAIGFVQESRAEAALEALRKMTHTTATVRRDGRTVRLDASALVPGDVVIVEAGDRVPADARLLAVHALEVQEAALTGESHAVTKSADAHVEAHAPLGDRVTALFMNTAVTRGRGEAVVTATGMDTEAGRIAGLLSESKLEATPLQRQIDALGRTLAWIAAAVILVVLGLGLLRGEDFGALFVRAVSLAVAAIPEGLPAVVAFTLAMGTGRLARHGAIIKRLASVETLGGTSQICTDKTGTLTLNQMTARAIWLAGRRFSVSGEGYETHGRIRSTDGSPVPASIGDALVAMGLCADAVLRDGEVLGDPTEGALVVLAEKGGIDVAALREARPRLFEVPFDSERKFMATFHAWKNAAGDSVVRCFVKGAPDVLAARAQKYVGAEGILPFDDMAREQYVRSNEKLAEQGMRVLALALQDFPADDFAPPEGAEAMLDGLVLLALVGIVDPPRPEARTAIAECRKAGIRVRMVTGDHAVTARAIASELGIPGTAIRGEDLDAIERDDELASKLDEVGVVARVSPAHKLRIVRALQARGDVVAMTGDGVNDAPALRKADIGVAMGKSGTEVSKESAAMVLTDDNFATIVRAVREGRGIYDNIAKFTRFQVSTSLGFVLTFLVAAVADIAGGAPFTALQILFVNFVMDGPPAMSLGVDPVSADAMTRPPRAPHARILTLARLGRIVVMSFVMSAGTLLVLVLAPGTTSTLGEVSVAGTMALVTFVFFQAFNLLNVRHETRSVFTREALESSSHVLVGTTAVVLLLICVVEMDALHGFFTTTDLESGQWLTCLAVASSVLWIGEVVKFIARATARRARRREASARGTRPELRVPAERQTRLG